MIDATMYKFTKRIGLYYLNKTVLLLINPVNIKIICVKVYF